MKRFNMFDFIELNDKFDSEIISKIVEITNELFEEMVNFNGQFVIAQKFPFGQRKLSLMRKYNVVKYEITITKVIVKKLEV